VQAGRLGTFTFLLFAQKKSNKRKGQQQQSRFLRCEKGQARIPPATAQKPGTGRSVAAPQPHPLRRRLPRMVWIIGIFMGKPMLTGAFSRRRQGL
jgi:hypothetical protein